MAYEEHFESDTYQNIRECLVMIDDRTNHVKLLNVDETPKYIDFHILVGLDNKESRLYLVIVNKDEDFVTFYKHNGNIFKEFNLLR